MLLKQLIIGTGLGIGIYTLTLLFVVLAFDPSGSTWQGVCTLWGVVCGAIGFWSVVEN